MDVEILEYIKNNPVNCIASALTIIGTWLVASLDQALQQFGFSIWVVSNFLWIVHGMNKKDYFLAFTFIILSVVNLIGIINRMGCE